MSKNNDDKKEISKTIKNIPFQKVVEEMDKLKAIGENAQFQSKRSRIGNNIVDYYTFEQRLETKGKYGVNFYEFVEQFDQQFREKKFIQNMLHYYETVKNKNNTKHQLIVLKEVYNICISAINIIRPLVYMEMYNKYKPKSILDFCAGWGGAAVASAALNIPSYTGIEINSDLQEPYDQLITFLKTKSTTDINMRFEDALKVDYNEIYYDFVFTSPPYYFIQKYANNPVYKDKKDMNELFYKPLFKKVYDGLEREGYFIINVCKEVYENVLFELFGLPDDAYPYKKSARQNNYQEMVYVWKKP